MVDHTQREVRIVRTFSATPEEVFDAWIDADALMHWMVPIPGGKTKAELDPRVGGRYRIEMIGNGETYPHEGEYLRVERPRLLEFTWISNATKRERSVVTVELRAIGEGATELTLTHKRLPSADSARSHEEGWNIGLTRLADLVARKAS